MLAERLQRSRMSAPVHIALHGNGPDRRPVTQEVAGVRVPSLPSKTVQNGTLCCRDRQPIAALETVAHSGYAPRSISSSTTRFLGDPPQHGHGNGSLKLDATSGKSDYDG
jgi:hypothetical protein